MFVTQSAVSHSIKALEQDLDCRLFNRSGKKIALTSRGEAFLERARKALREIQYGVEELSDLNKWGHGKLRIGATDSMCQYLLPAVLREFRESFPNCDIAVSAEDSRQLIDQVAAGDIDVALGLLTDESSPALEFRPLFEDRMAFAFSPLHPWADLEAIPESAYQDQRYIVFARKSYTFRMIEGHFQRRGVRLSSILELGNMESIKEMAKIGLGVGILAPWMALKEVSEGSLVQIPVIGNGLRRRWGLYHLRTKELSLAETTFAGICETVSREFSD